jgi:hypothetical protein
MDLKLKKTIKAIKRGEPEIPIDNQHKIVKRLPQSAIKLREERRGVNELKIYLITSHSNS